MQYSLGILTLIYIILQFYPLGDPKVICETDTDGSGGPIMRILCSAYRYVLNDC